MTARVGVVGLGRMGSRLARRLAGAGHEVVGLDPSPSARRLVAAAGLVVVDTPDQLDASAVLTSLPDTTVMEEVYLGEGGLLSVMGEGALCVDLSTVAVSVSRQVGERAARVGIDFLDAPVSGTTIHAEAGTLTVMVGGRREAFERARPLLAPFASSVHHLGPVGAGLEMKLITNRLLTSCLVAIAEAVLELEQAGLEVPQGLDVLRAGAVPRLLEYKAAPLAERDTTPLFTVDLMSKDLRLAALQREPGPLASVAASLLEATREAGRGAADIVAVIEELERHMGGSS